MTRLLILTCSARKRGGPEPTPVVDRYDGPLWQVLRSYLREQPMFAADLAIYGLSAEFGLIPGDQRIPHYDRTMDPEQADALRPQVLETFAELMGQGYDQLCLGVSDRYLRAMEGWQALAPADVTVRVTDGPMGAKLGQLRAWLEGRAWAPAERPAHLAAPAAPRGEVVLAGVRLQLSREDVVAQGRAALATDGAGAGRYRDWYVLLDGRPVAAKWLAGVISGLPTSKFDAANARRALLALGVDVERAV
ncbi:hypothetical protein K2Z83_11435 [Oscillochloris sp. ZM17-4]|uniref:DUF6884 domain-containing protein n=1 Tax=Oscillochloris sp. ZM17-4 TaxID=2866714 RepID=UPI001C73B1C6|nr:hypothetical protein [Oscillochloris sp. ZM17-4]MBX0328288.1 hypothetical protein [Oscillochloris sp. ZM17-4]